MGWYNNKNRYLKNSRISEAKFRQVLKLFCDDFIATQVSQQAGLVRKTVNKLFMLFRKKMVGLCATQGKFGGEVEIDESCFGARRVRGKRGRGAKGKTPVVRDT